MIYKRRLIAAFGCHILITTYCCHHLITVFDFSSLCYDIVFVIILLRCFICMRTIQTGETDNRGHSSQYIIKFVGFILIYYVINLNIVSSFMIFSNCILNLSIYYKF